MSQPNSQLNESIQSWRWPALASGVIVLVLAIVVLTPVRQMPNENNTLTSAGGASALRPTSTAAGVQWRTFADSGNIDYEVRAAYLEQYQSLQLMKVEQPEIRLASQHLTPWTLYAQRGEITRQQGGEADDENTAAIDQLRLFGDVVMSQRSEDPSKAIALSTSQLDIFPAKQHATTTAKVTVSHQRFITISDGLDLNFETGTVRFAPSTPSRVVSTLFLNPSAGALNLDQ